MKFKLPVQWMMTADMEIEADTLSEAIAKAGDAPLPDGEYLDSSFEVNHEVLNEEGYGQLN